MTELVLNGEQFMRRSKALYEKTGKPLLVMLGRSADVQEFNANSALFHHLLGYEFPETVLILGPVPIAVVSAKKALLLRQIPGLRIEVKSREDSDLDALLDRLRGECGGDGFVAVGLTSAHGDFCARVMARLAPGEVLPVVLQALLVKEADEVALLRKAGQVANNLLRRGIDLIRDLSFSKEELENCMNEPLRGIDSNLIEYAFDPLHSSNHLRLGIRYRGYCVEIGRGFMADVAADYEVQRCLLGAALPGVSSRVLLDRVREKAAECGAEGEVLLYTLGLLVPERSFADDFVLEKGTVFCLRIGERFANTFVMEDAPAFLTRRDTADEYAAARMRFRNKGHDALLAAQIREHQKELLDRLTETQAAFYRKNRAVPTATVPGTRAIAVYEKEACVPRSALPVLDTENFYVIVPLLSYAVPFHITCIKNLALAHDNTKLRINFKESKEVQAELCNREGGIDMEENEVEGNDVSNEDDAPNVSETPNGTMDTFLKAITIKVPNAEQLLAQINEMKKTWNRPSLPTSTQSGLKEKFKKYALTDVYLRTDTKATSKKTLASLELHENGLRYGDVVFLFSAIKNVFRVEADLETKAALHFALRSPVVVHGKPTNNLQFYRRYGFSYHDTSKREDDRMDQIMQEEEEAENTRTNSEFAFFADRIEQDSALRVQEPEPGFLGVHAKEAVHLSVTPDCLLAIADQPFFVLNFDEVEIVNFERVTFVTKTFDCIFVFADKTRPVATISSIEITRLAFLKELIDSHNIVFMETKINLNWPNLLAAIMKDPYNFYHAGAWAELLQDDPEEDSEALSQEDDTSESEVSSVNTTSSSEASSESSYSDEDASEDASLVSSDEEEEDESSSSEKPKKRKK